MGGLSAAHRRDVAQPQHHHRQRLRPRRRDLDLAEYCRADQGDEGNFGSGQGKNSRRQRDAAVWDGGAEAKCRGVSDTPDGRATSSNGMQEEPSCSSRTAREPSGFISLWVPPDSCCLLLAYETWRPPVFGTNFEPTLS